MKHVCTIEKCSRASFIGINVIFYLIGTTLLIGSYIVRYDNNTVDKCLDYSSFQTALQSANVRVHIPDSLNIGETIDPVCIVFIVAGVVFLLLGVLGIIGAICKVKALLITYAVVLLVIVSVELVCVIVVATIQGKIESWIKEPLKDSIINDYTGIGGNDTVTLRWNFIMHSFKCCGVDNYTDFILPEAKRSNKSDVVDGTFKANKLPFVFCKQKNDTNFVLEPASSSAFIEKGCYQAIKDWVISNMGVLIGVGASILAIELILVGIAFLMCCTLRMRVDDDDDDDNKDDKDDNGPIKPFRLPHAHLVSPYTNRFYPSNVVSNPVYEGPRWHDSSLGIYPPHSSRELDYDHNEHVNAYDRSPHDHHTYSGLLNGGLLSPNESFKETSLRGPSRTSSTLQSSSEVPYAKPWKREIINEYPERTAALRHPLYFGGPPSEYC